MQVQPGLGNWRGAHSCVMHKVVRKLAHMTELEQMALPGLKPDWTLGDRLRKARETAGLNQTQLADELEIARNSVGRYESGDYDPPRTVIIAWALRTGVDFQWLLGDHQGKRRRGGYRDMGDYGPPSDFMLNPDIPSGISAVARGGYTNLDHTAIVAEFRKRLPLGRTAHPKVVRTVRS